MEAEVCKFKPVFSMNAFGVQEYNSENFDYNILLEREKTKGLRKVTTTETCIPTEQEWALVQELVPNVRSVGLVDRYNDGVSCIYYCTMNYIAYDGFVRISQKGD